MMQGNILITGGAGTLGRAIARRAKAQNWNAQLTIYSRSEFLQAEMRRQHPECRYILGDVADYDRLSAAIAGHNYVIHAAAMKRIPEAEAQPWACYTTNVIGSHNVARACTATGVQRCIGVSTDKACMAVTAYGASKLAMEKLFQSQPDGSTIFTLVRYGNVVASRGSVIPLWRQQAEHGLPLTITDRRCTRFFMSESDAVDLVQLAATIPSGVILVPKMAALSIVELAEIVAPGAITTEIGLRSCEKIHEDLIHLDERVNVAAEHYWIRADNTGQQLRYTSEIAPRLAPSDFLAMLEEAEQHEYA